jgi:hypothetical protein
MQQLESRHECKGYIYLYYLIHIFKQMLQIHSALT